MFFGTANFWSLGLSHKLNLLCPGGRGVRNRQAIIPRIGSQRAFCISVCFDQLNRCGHGVWRWVDLWDGGSNMLWTTCLKVAAGRSSWAPLIFEGIAMPHWSSSEAQFIVQQKFSKLFHFIVMAFLVFNYSRYRLMLLTMNDCWQFFPNWQNYHQSNKEDTFKSLLRFEDSITRF